MKEEKKFYPSYTEIGGDKIYETSDMELGDFRCGYFADTNCKVQFYADYVGVVDLSNAMKTGKECSERRFVPEGRNLNSVNELKLALLNQDIKTIADLFSAKYIEGFETNYYSKKSVKVFSPFVEVKPITQPSKWTKADVAKAILTGQIFDGITNGNYTDDYAYDAEVNFGRDKKLDLIDVARELIEEYSMGIIISEDEVKDGITSISVNTFHFNSKTLYFDIDQTHEMSQQETQEETMAWGFNGPSMS